MSESSGGDDAEAAGGTDSPSTTDAADTSDTPDSAPGTEQAEASDGSAPVVVCFDMDGVLVDSEDYWHAAEREEILPRVLDGDHPDLDEVTGMYYGEIYDYLDAEYETTVEKAEFMNLYDETAETIYGEQVDLLDGARAFVEELRGEGVPVALVSSSPRDWIDVVLDRFDLSFDLIAPAEEFDGAGKPEPGLFEAAIADLGGVPARAVVVEDSANGVLGAARSGAYTIAVRDAHNAETDLSAADEVVDRTDPEVLYDAVRQSTRTMRESVSGSNGSSG